MKTENLSTLNIHKLTQAQYERELAAGRIDENAIYLTPDEGDSDDQELPEYSSQNEGDFLRIVGGEVVWNSLPHAEDGEFGDDESGSTTEFIGKSFKLSCPDQSMTLEGYFTANNEAFKQIEFFIGDDFYGWYTYTSNNQTITAYGEEGYDYNWIPEYRTITITGEISNAFKSYLQEYAEDVTDAPIKCSSSFHWIGDYISPGLEYEWSSDNLTYPFDYPQEIELTYPNYDGPESNWSIQILEDTDNMIHSAYFSDAQHIKFKTNSPYSSRVKLLVKYEGEVQSGNGYQWIEETITGYLDYCLLEGTQILMADGSTKAIEDLQSGDMMKSWDFEKNEYIDVRCLAAFDTGADAEWQEYSFSNGKTLRIAHDHAVYNQEDGFVKNAKGWKLGATGLGLDGSAPKLTAACNQTSKEPKNHYTILSENNVYFADGILCGHRPSKKYTIYRAGLISCEITPEQVELFKEEHREGHLNADWKKNPKFIAEARKYGRYNDVKAEADKLKADISARDYKTIKRMQGALSDEEWEENLTICADLRTQINEREALCTKIIRHHRDVRESLGYPRNPKSVRKLFEEGMAKDLAFIRARNEQ